jgi:uncharacterized membrane protein YphA (DoxX/SURF4 family)
MVAVVMLVVLRVTIGWHFLYEGVWKIVNADKFSAAGFLGAAKGPAAPLFYWMVPDMDGRQRLNLQERVDEKGKTFFTSEAYEDAWARLKDQVIARYGLSGEQAEKAEKTFELYRESLRGYLTDNREDIEAHFGSVRRLKQRKAAGTNGAAHEKKRRWDEQIKLRSEVNGWLSDLDGMAEEYQLALWSILNEDQKARGPIRAPLSEADALPVSLPFAATWSGLLDFAVTYGLSAIGLCLMIGFCTRLAALGGAAFLFTVVLVQMPWPTVYPPAPEVVGHALLVDKNFVEMIAMVMLATTAVGRWGGLDFFVYHWLGRPILARFSRPEASEE